MPKRLSIYRLILFIVGASVLAFGQYILYQPVPVFSLGQMAVTWNNTFRLDALNPDNLIVGGVIVFIGGLIAAAGLGWPLVKSLTDTKSIAAEQSPDALISATAEAAPEAIRAVRFDIRLREYFRRHGMLIVVDVILFAILIRQTSLADTSHTLVVIWLVALALLIHLAVQWDRLFQVSLATAANRRDWAIIASLLVFGFIVNGYALSTVPNSIIGDEAGFYSRAAVIAQGKDMFSMFDLGVYSYPLLSSEYQGVVMAFFNSSFWSWRFASVLISVLALIPTYLLALEIFGRRVAILSGVVLLSMPWFIAFARMGYNNSQAILPVALSLYWLYMGVKRRSTAFYTLSAVAAGIGYYTYTAGRLALAVGGVFVIYTVIANVITVLKHTEPPTRRFVLWRGIRQDSWLAAVFVAACLLTVAPSVLFSNVNHPNLASYKTLESLLPNTVYARSIYSDAEMSRDHPLFKVGDQEYFYRFDLYADLVVRGVIRTVLSFNVAPGMIVSHYLAAPLAGPVGVPFYMFGMLLLLRRVFRRENFLLELWFFGGLFLLSIIATFPSRYTHTVSVIPVLSIFIAVGIASASDLLFGVLRFLRQPIPLLVIEALMVFMVGANIYNYYVEMPQLYPTDIDNAMGFQVLGLNAPTDVVFISNDPGRGPGYVPWLVNNIPNPATFETIRPEMPMTVNFPTVKDLIVFCDPSAKDSTAELLTNWFNDSAVKAPIAYNYINQSYLYEWIIPKGQQQKPRVETF